LVVPDLFSPRKEKKKTKKKILFPSVEREESIRGAMALLSRPDEGGKKTRRIRFRFSTKEDEIKKQLLGEREKKKNPPHFQKKRGGKERPSLLK